MAGSSGASSGERIGDEGPGDIVGDTVREGIVRVSGSCLLAWRSEQRWRISREGQTGASRKKMVCRVIIFEQANKNEVMCIGCQERTLDYHQIEYNYLWCCG